MENKEWMPIGSVVYLKNGYKKLMIIGRGMIIQGDEGRLFFDYGGVQYPEGLMGDEIAYFQKDAIEKIVFKGFSDDDDEMTAKRIDNYIESTDDLKRG